MMADLRWIEDFLDLAATRNFSRSADNRLVTQSAFSRRIQNLEEWVGSALVDRSSKPIQLTKDGERFVSAAEHILLLAGKLEAAPQTVVDAANVGSDSLDEATEETEPTGTGHDSETPAHQNLAQSERIMIVDDSAVSLQIIKRIVEMLGHEPVIFEDSRNALQSLPKTKPSIILTDCEMPDFDGYQLAIAIRDVEKKDNRHTPIVAVTGHSTLGTINRCFDAGMDDYLRKPIGGDELLVVINRWLSRNETVEGVENAWLSNVVPNTTGSDPGVFLAREFCAITRQRVMQISEHIEQGEAPQVVAMLPSIKSEAFMVGAYSFGRSCGQLEKSARSGDFTVMLEKLGPFLASFVKLERAVRPNA